MFLFDLGKRVFLFDLGKREDEIEDLAWNKTCDWLLLARGILTQFQNDAVIG